MTVDAPVAVARLLAGLAGGGGPGLDRHVDVFGAPPVSRRGFGHPPERLRAEVQASGLSGRGGAGFPTARKLDALARHRRRPVLVANAMEGEPASAKDAVLLTYAPHLVLDGAQVAARAVGADSVVVCAPAGSLHLAALRDALAERDAAGMDPVAVQLAPAPAHYAAGEESALVDWVGGGRGLPTYRPDKGIPLVAAGRNVLVQNVETLAHLALIARHGARWFRSVGTAGAPGTALVTVSGAVPRPGVLEVELGTPIVRILERAGVDRPPRALLVGGYGGAWLSGACADLPYEPSALAAHGAGIGAGVIASLGPDSCGMAETARVVSYLSSQRAGQCGPCTFGMPALSDDLHRLAIGYADGWLLERLASRLDAVDGRGACRLPDGAVRLVRSALDVFASDIRAHAGNRPCPSWDRRSVLRFPEPQPRPAP